MLVSDMLWSCESKREYLAQEFVEGLDEFRTIELYDYVFKPSGGDDPFGTIEVTGVKDGSYVLGQEYHFEITLQE